MQLHHLGQGFYHLDFGCLADSWGIRLVLDKLTALWMKNACFYLLTSLFNPCNICSTIGKAALNCCLIPPGQSSKSVAPINGSMSSILCLYTPSLSALFTASRACLAVDSGFSGTLYG
mmetsp:Transcript_13318/g.19927  ORF Transcript_13318/g.19927 Transcript_13318/m.19927 type:complete len:118 (+) Transcript_13318:324-677(+)